MSPAQRAWPGRTRTGWSPLRHHPSSQTRRGGNVGDHVVNIAANPGPRSELPLETQGIVRPSPPPGRGRASRYRAARRAQDRDTDGANVRPAFRTCAKHPSGPSRAFGWGWRSFSRGGQFVASDNVEIQGSNIFESGSGPPSKPAFRKELAQRSVDRLGRHFPVAAAELDRSPRTCMRGWC